MAKSEKGKGGDDKPEKPEKPRTRGEKEVRIYSLATTVNECIIFLEELEGSRLLPIWIGIAEGQAIAIRFSGIVLPRPLTHDLLVNMLAELDVEVLRVTVTELRENTFYAQITVTQDGQEIELDSRPSDAIALAIRAEAPIFAADEVITESAIEFEHEVEDTEEVVEKFKDFLDQVTPEDFASDE
ncbi:MAG: bifunctional nuclease family protein [Solirubrobacteraceae bacterium]